MCLGYHKALIGSLSGLVCIRTSSLLTVINAYEHETKASRIGALIL